ncbi:MAG: sigma-70 family RNA polymerase sigma factor [Planctomycetales bacterium]|nr:sigma-70 family RNA polymerase sigma factor [Planctomycetales bacterium]
MEVPEPAIRVSNEGAQRMPDIGELVAEHYRAVYAYAYRLTGNANDAEDLVQHAFLIAQQKIDQLREASRAKSWLFRILRNCFLRSLEKKRPAAASDVAIEVADIAALDLVQEFDSELLQAAIDELPAEFKLVVVMFYFDQLSYKEIAKEIDSPIGTVMSRLARAKAALRRRLARND